MKTETERIGGHWWGLSPGGGGGGGGHLTHVWVPGGTPLYELYGDVPLDRVWFLASLP